MTFEISIVIYNFPFFPNISVNEYIIISKKINYLNVQTINVNLDAEFILHKHRCFDLTDMSKNASQCGEIYTKRGYEGKIPKENCRNNLKEGFKS